MTIKQRDTIYWKFDKWNETIQKLITQDKMMTAISNARASEIINSDDEKRIERYLKAVWRTV